MRHGVTYDEDSTAFASPTLKEFSCFRVINGAKYKGPSVIGSMLEIEAPITSDQGTVQFRVRAKPYKTYFADIELLSQPVGDQAFKVLNSESSMLNIRYPEQGITGAPCNSNNVVQRTHTRRHF